MNTTNYSVNFRKFYDYAEHSICHEKSLDSTKNLDTLNLLINKFAAKTIKDILKGKIISKFDVPHIQDISNGKVDKQYGKYGHLLLDDTKSIRVSTCLNNRNFYVQIPKKEEQFWNKNSYVFFTNGDLFLMVNSEKLKNIPKIETKLQNYQIEINNLLKLNEISFGLRKEDKISYIKNGEESFIDLNESKLSKEFYNFKSRGCMSSLKPKYFVFERNGKIDFDEHGSTFKSLNAIENYYKLGFTRQYLGRLATKNAEILDRIDVSEPVNIFNMLKKVSKNKKDFYVVAIDDLEDSLAKIKFCLLDKKDEYNKKMDEKCSIKKAIFYLKKVRSSEEYTYYKNNIIEHLGYDFSLRDCIFLKEMNQIDNFEYLDNQNYHYYKQRKNYGKNNV